MDDLTTYRIELAGHIDLQELNAASPYRASGAESAGPNTCIAVRTDQSGLMGLLRYLHGRGYTLLSVQRTPSIHE